jgi:hypothetical protein
VSEADPAVDSGQALQGLSDTGRAHQFITEGERLLPRCSPTPTRRTADSAPEPSPENWTMTRKPWPPSPASSAPMPGSTRD